MKADKIIVHAGSFHSDDVMCVALAEIAFPGIEVERVYTVPEGAAEDERVIVADIGGGKYDHHQRDARRRASGEKYAGCGLLFEDIGEMIFPDRHSAKCFETDFIIPIELTDNGVCNDPLSIAIKSMNPLWDEDADVNEAFRKAVELTKQIVLREVRSKESELAAAKMVREALAESENGVVILGKRVPWEMTLIPSDARFVIWPSTRGGFDIRIVPVEPGSFKAKQELPEAWLKERPEGCRFVHSARFIASFKDFDSAVAAARTL